MPYRIPKGKKKLTDEEIKANKITFQKKYNASEKGKAVRAKYNASEKGKVSSLKYRNKTENKIRKKELSQRPERKAQQRQWYLEYNTEERRENTSKKRQMTRLKILKKYSKNLSNSNIPCCRCCGLDNHANFLAIDHITGRKEMDSNPELVKLGYSSELKGVMLHEWIIKNNFPKGFQILCHNCNLAKGFYGICPHETARKEETFAMMEEQSSFEV